MSDNLDAIALNAADRIVPNVFSTGENPDWFAERIQGRLAAIQKVARIIRECMDTASHREHDALRQRLGALAALWQQRIDAIGPSSPTAAMATATCRGQLIAALAQPIPQP